MALDRLRGLARRVKQRVVGGRGVGDGFGPAQDTAFARLDDNADASFQLVGASIVGTWEVTLTDLSRALQSGPLAGAEAAKLLERVSDALVPTQEPLQGAGRAYRRALKAGVQQALQSGRLADATAPLSEALEPLPAGLARGWQQTVVYLEPVLLALDPSGALSATMATRGDALRAVVAEQNAAYRGAMDALPQAAALDGALNGALDAWRGGVSRGLELFLYDQRTAMVQAAERLRG